MHKSKNNLIYQKILFLFLPFLLLSCQLQSKNTIDNLTRIKDYKDDQIKKINYQIINTYPHDINNFTQGLSYYDGLILESTGIIGESRVIIYDPKNNKIIAENNQNKSIFGEGSTILNDKIYQITWKDQKAFVYDKDLNLINTFDYRGEGWGITEDGKNLIMSNGTNRISYINPQNFKEIKHFNIDFSDFNISNTLVNELEYVSNKIFANLWQTDKIIIIDEKTNKITAYIDITDLSLKAKQKMQSMGFNISSDFVANGVAYNKDNDNYYITGKNWPLLFEIKLIR